MASNPLSRAWTRVASFAGRSFGQSRAALGRGIALFPRAFEQRASAVGRLIFIATGGQIRRTEIKYEDLAKEGYESNPVVYRCIRFIADALKSMPVIIMDGEKEVAPEHPMRLVFDAPNPDQVWEELVDAIVGHLVLAGECFLEGVRLDRGALAEINALRPDKTNPLPAEDGTVAAYIYEGMGGSVRFDIDPKPLTFRPILHIKNWHPRDQWRGLPSLGPASGAGDEHNQAVAYQKALYTNSARPSGAMVYEPKEGPASLSDASYDRLKNEMEDHHQGTGNAGRPMLLDGGLRWEQMGLSPKDLESGEGRSAAAREIALALGVPPLMLGIKGDNTFANFAEAKLAFWEFTVLPLAKLLQKKLTAWVRPLSPSISIKLDIEGSPIAESAKKDRWERVNAASFLKVNEKREALGYEPVPDGDHILVAIGNATLEDVVSAAPPNPLAAGKTAYGSTLQ